MKKHTPIIVLLCLLSMQGIAQITGTFTVCIGSTTQLTDGIPGSIWSSTNTSVATVDYVTGLVTPISVGTTIISDGINGETVTVTSIPTINIVSGANPVCEGGTLTLTDAESGGTWSYSDGFYATIGSISGILTANDNGYNGTVTVTYTVGSCLTTFDVNIIPNPTPIQCAGGECPGITITLSDASAGGVWSGEGNAIVSGAGTSGTLVAGPGPSGGSATITYTLPTGCITTNSIVIFPSPPQITGNFAVCVNEVTILSDVVSPVGPGWTTSDNLVAIAVGGDIWGESAGTATITFEAFIPGYCTTTAVVTVNPLPNGITGTQVLCAGAVTNLTDAGGGTWSSSNTVVATVDGTGTVTGQASGTTTVTYTLSTGCTTTTIVTVNPLPSGITGTPVVCAGAVTNLTDAGGGTWSSSVTTVATVNGSGSVTGQTSGTTTVTYTLSTGCTATTIVTVNPLPSSITGALSVCVGAVTNLTDAGGGTWSSSVTTVATINGSGSVTGQASGTTTVTYTLSTGCTATTIVTANPLPSGITGTPVVCAGAVTNLTDAGGGTWSSSVTTVATVNGSGSVTGQTSGTTTVTYTLSTGCTATTIVTVNPLPSSITGALSVCVGAVTNLTDAGGGTWSSSVTTVATINGSGSVTGQGSGTTTVTYTLSTGCTATSIVTVNSNPLAITGSQTVCTGSVTSLTDAGGGTWSSSNTIVATVNGTGNVTGQSTGTTTISYILGTGCGTKIVVTDNPLPSVIIGTLTVCSGLETDLTDAGGGTWSSNNTIVATIDGTGAVTGQSAGTTVISYTLSTGCSSTAIVSVNETPSACVTYDASDNYVFSGTPNATVTYTVYNIIGVAVCTSLTTTLDATGSSTISGSELSVLCLLAHEVCITAVVLKSCSATGTFCCASSGPGRAPFDFENHQTGGSGISFNLEPNIDTNESGKNKVQLYIGPDPNKGTFAIIGKGIKSTTKEAKIEVMDMMGNTIFSDEVQVIKNEINKNITLNQNLANGVYFLRLVSDSTNTVVRFLLSK